MKERIIKILIIISGIVSTVMFLSVHFETPRNFLIDKAISEDNAKAKRGDLYYLCRVDSFKEELPDVYTYDFDAQNPPINDADILIFGDSFFKHARNSKTLPELLGDSLCRKIFFSSSIRPLFTLSENYKKGKRKIILFEIVERDILSVISRPMTISDARKKYNVAIIEKIIPRSKEDYYTLLIKDGIISGRIYNNLMTFKFNVFGIISDLTPVYKKEPYWLFYYPDIIGNGGFYYRHTDKEIKEMADRFEILQRTLSDEFNLELIFLAPPNKYTLYHRFLNNDEYSGFLTKLYRELDKRNVNTVNVFDIYNSSEEIYYYPTDTHWNEKGMLIALNLILTKIRTLETIYD